MEQLPPLRANLAPTLATLFLSFLRLGRTAFGGPAMVAYIRRMVVQQKSWLDDEAFRAGVALCQTIPGATAMQTAAYVGFRTRGVRGAAASFVGFGLPAFCLMVILSALYAPTHGLPVITAAFDGLQAIIIGIVANATLTFGKAYLKGWRDVLLAGMAGGLFDGHVAMRPQDAAGVVAR
ncbi:MAG: chromate transporter [Anaerolineae bacterium]